LGFGRDDQAVLKRHRVPSYEEPTFTGCDAIPVFEDGDPAAPALLFTFIVGEG
jgi:hypothetical protein